MNVPVNVSGALLGSSVEEVAKMIQRQLLRVQSHNTTLGFA
jgi:hypothetical protein